MGKKLELGTTIRITPTDDKAPYRETINDYGMHVRNRKYFTVLQPFDTKLDVDGFSNCSGDHVFDPDLLKSHVAYVRNRLVEPHDTDAEGWLKFPNTLCIAEQLIAEGLI